MHSCGRSWTQTLPSQPTAWTLPPDAFDQEGVATPQWGGQGFNSHNPPE